VEAMMKMSGGRTSMGRPS